MKGPYKDGFNYDTEKKKAFNDSCHIFVDWKELF